MVGYSTAVCAISAAGIGITCKHAIVFLMQVVKLTFSLYMEHGGVRYIVVICKLCLLEENLQLEECWDHVYLRKLKIEVIHKLLDPPAGRECRGIIVIKLQ